MRFNFNIKKDPKGQTVVEYLLMLMVMVTVITSLLSYIKNKYLGDLTKCNQGQNSKTILCKINGIISPSENGKKFQYYRFR